MENTTELHYSHNRFPFSGILEDLTEWAKTNNSSPLETYLYFRRLRRNKHLTPCPDYASTSITTGGHARRPNLKTREIVSANTNTARKTISLMSEQGSIDSRAVVLPVDLANIPSWKQSAYIEFWSLIISGIDLGIRPTNANAKKYEDILAEQLDHNEVDLDIMDDSGQSSAERAPEYFRFAGAFSETVSRTAVESYPVRRVVSLVDPTISLGCQTERLLAKMLTIPVQRVIAVVPAEKMQDSIPDYELRNDLETIIRFGGTVVGLAKNNMLTLQNEPTAELQPVA